MALAMNTEFPSTKFSPCVETLPIPSHCSLHNTPALDGVAETYLFSFEGFTCLRYPNGIISKHLRLLVFYPSTLWPHCWLSHSCKRMKLISMGIDE